ncbi:MAG: zinc dependent phospholipase C family protein [Thermoproteota archaeon]
MDKGSHGTVRSIPIAVFLIILMQHIAENSYGWSNGGYSSDPTHPKYGTHDWIAQHALDWLPNEEKAMILSNLNIYLYGTELPDNGQAPDGIGDTGKHHVYYYANGSLQDDASARRAQEEFSLALSYYRAGNITEVVKRLGAMTHYISDMAVFAHVMGSRTDWGGEKHHGGYEEYVNSKTSAYSEFSEFLSFDGSLEKISAYEAALRLAYDTTFDVDGNLTCVWMDSNYDWDNPLFQSRCEESLNLAVNLVADILHTFYVETSVTSQTSTSTPTENPTPKPFPSLDTTTPNHFYSQSESIYLIAIILLVILIAIIAGSLLKRR